MATSVFTPYTLGDTVLQNRIVMAPMTRSRALNNIPNAVMTEYYAQRSTAGLIITEGVSPSPNGLGYARMPGIFTKTQTLAWKPIANAIHENGGKAFMQLMHAGRIGHPHNLPTGARVIAPSSVRATGQLWTDREGMQDNAIPQELTREEIESTKHEFVLAALNAMTAGFDGVELHAANGYLLNQFLSPHANQRTDNYGGSVENRSRFVLEVAQAVSDAIGAEKVGVRLSPYGLFNDIANYDEIDATYTHLAEELNKIGVVYLHLLDHNASGQQDVPDHLRRTLRETFNGTIIWTGGYDLVRAQRDLANGSADLIGFGKPFINNPDFVTRLQKNYPLNSILDFSTFYAAGEKGYTDYALHSEEVLSA